MSPRNYNAKFSPNGNEFWWTFSKNSMPVHYKKPKKKDGIIKKILNRFKKNSYKDFK